MHGVHRERVGGAHHPADVGVLAEVLDRDVEPVAPPVDVGDDRLARPVPVGVDDVAGVAVAQQIRVIARIVGQRTLPGTDSAWRDAPFSGPGGRARSLARVHTAAWVPTIETVAYSSACVDLTLGAQRRVDVHRVQ